ncbi:unnamed protein product [Cunninghamella echinulata]
MPWRKPADPHLNKEALAQRAYEVWVSEIMLQQTQVATVIGYYNRWMEKFPTIFDLAKADIEEVNKLWAGLGYYSRASRLWSGAKLVVEKYDGCLPNNAKDLEISIPGIGAYTAGAIASIVFQQQTPLVDGNVIRVLSRLRTIGGDMKKGEIVKLFWSIAKTIVPSSRPGDFNQALMELGARVCTPQNPQCERCPVQDQCRALAHLKLHTMLMDQVWKKKEEDQKEEKEGSIDHECQYCPVITENLEHENYAVTRYPVKSDKKPPRDEECAVCILEATSNDNESIESKYLITKRPEKGLLAGLWEFPTVELNNTKSTYKQRSQHITAFLKDQHKINLNEIKHKRQNLENVVHLFSHIRKVYHVEWVSLSNEDVINISIEGNWVTMEELKTSPIPTGLKKAIKLLEKAQKTLSTSSSSSSLLSSNKRKQPINDNADISSYFKKKK